MHPGFNWVLERALMDTDDMEHYDLATTYTSRLCVYVVLHKSGQSKMT